MTSATDSPRHRRLIAAGDVLAPRSFPVVGAAGTVSWNQGITASVIFSPHLGPCPDCERYVGGLDGAAENLREWATQAVVLLAPGAVAPPGRRGGRTGVLVVADEKGAGRSHLGVDGDQAVVVQADRWGAVYEVVAAGADHGCLPQAAELVGLAKYIDIQCPECGVPSKEWLSATPFPLG